MSVSSARQRLVRPGEPIRSTMPALAQRPRFKSHVRVDVVDRDRICVIRERSHHILHGRLYPLLVPFIDGHNTVDEIIERLTGQATPADVRFGISELEADGLIVDVVEDETPELATLADVLEISTGVLRERLRATPVTVASVGGLSGSELIEALGSVGIHLSPDGDIELVIADDYLNPDLAGAHRRARESGRPWMLIKPVGPEFWLGPIFRPREKGCWTCLVTRLQENAGPVVRSRGPSGSATTVSPPVTARMGLAAAATQLLRWIATERNPELEGALLTVGWAPLRTERHVFVPVEDCPDCGDSNHAPRSKAETLNLSQALRIVSSDGGYRVRSPEDTWARYRHHVSPLTGIIRELAVQPVQGAEAVQVYVADHVFRSDWESDAFEERSRRKSCGKGSSRAQARASALCEALERYSGVFRGNEPRKTACFADFPDQAIHPSAVLNFSDRQYQERGRWNADVLRPTWVPERFDESRAIEWTPARSLTDGNVKHVPTALCYYGYPRSADHDFCRPDSNGCAAGNTLEEALLQGFLELVERDAVALWWYNRARRPGVETASFADPRLDALVASYRDLGRALHVLDITTDLGIPVFAAVSSESAATMSRPLLGFGAHFDARIGVARALTEAAQFLPGAMRGSQRRLFAGEIADPSFLLPEERSSLLGRGNYACVEGDDIGAWIHLAVTRAQQHGLEVLTVNQTRPDVGLPVIKVIVPGLRHYWPRFGPGRLYSVPVDLRWLEAPVPEPRLNPAHIII